jgi:maleylacetoacetate isomerase
MATQVTTTHTRTDQLPQKVTLYSYHLSSCAWRVQLALLFKGIPYEYKAVDLSRGEQFSDEFTKLNPLQMVPVLAIDGVTLVDSIGILLYLEERFPDKRPLLPKDLVQRAQIHQVVSLISAYIQPLQMGGILATIEAKFGKDEQLKWIQDVFRKGFSALEQILIRTAGKYCFGDTVTLADIVLVPQFGNAIRLQVDLAPYPTIQRVGEALNELAEVKSSVPANQPDAPKS